MRALYLADLGSFVRYHDIRGRNPARVYLHGLDTCSAALVEVATHPNLSGNRSLLLDLLGFGLSDKPDIFSYTVEDHAEVVIHVLDELGLRGCEMIGHSSGGSVAIVIAARRPELVSSLVVAEANLAPGMGPVSAGILEHSEDEYVRQGFRADLNRLQNEIRTHPRSTRAVTISLQVLASPRAMYRTARSLTRVRSPSFRELLVGLSMPRAFLVGAHTLEAEQKPASGEAGESLAGTEVHRLLVPDAGHPMMLDNPDGFAAAIAEALVCSP